MSSTEHDARTTSDRFSDALRSATTEDHEAAAVSNYMNELFQGTLSRDEYAEMVAQHYMKKGALVPVHAHESEQMTYVLQGALRALVNGDEVIVREGEILHVPPQVPHQAEAIEDTFTLDLFCPIRPEWLDQPQAAAPAEDA